MTPFSSYLFMGGFALLNVLVNRFVLIDQQLFAETQIVQNDQGRLEFDFIVVGGGTSGSVVASRLAQNYSVLIIEAGGDPFLLMKIPGMSSLFLANPKYDWAYLTVPQIKSCLSHKNRQSLWVSGRALGGTSNLNYMVYIRGHHLDYDNWAAITGDDRWKYKNFVKFFKRAEDYHVTANEKYFGRHGPVHVNSISFRPVARHFFEAAKELGYKVVHDINLPFDEGFGNYSYVSKNGRRWGTFSAYIEQVRKRTSNLRIYKYSTATRILIDKLNRAYGVEFEFNGKRYSVTARKEVIVSAGSVGSPKLLMLSGIGNKAHLDSIGIPVKADLPVGENLQDHLIAFVGPFTLKQKLTFVADRDLKVEDVTNFFQNGIGPLTSTGIQATGIIQSNYSKRTGKVKGSKIWPDNQLILAVLPLPQDGPSFISRGFNLRSDIAEAYYRPVSGKDSFHIMSIASRPKSRGNIRLANADFRTPALIDPKYLTDPHDAEVMLDGIRTIMRLTETTEGFRKVGAELSSTPFPSCKHLPHKSDSYWRCYLEHFSASAFHPVGTCSMGPAGSDKAVVDSSLRVKGVQNLRVIDASIMPVIVSSNTQAACIAIGEFGAELVKESWETKSQKGQNR